MTDSLPIAPGAAADLARAGVAAVLVHGAHGLADDAPTPCAGWAARDLIRHLEAIAGMYLLAVSAALGGRTADLRVGDDLAAYNAQMLARLPAHPTADHLERFASLAEDHLRVAETAPDLPMYRAPSGHVLTVGEHIGIAAVEWHIHAWDLAVAGGTVHAPDADDLAAIWRMLIADEVAAPLPDGTAWHALLVASGRRP